MTNPKPVPPIPSPHPHKHHHPHWKRKVAHWSRLAHVYLSMASLAILLFFALTGITLNHQDRFTGQPQVSHYQGTVPAAWVKPAPGKDPARLEIVEHLRKTHGVKAALSDFHVDDDQLEVAFKGPGYEANAVIDRNTGKYEGTESRMGLVAVVNDLHKGRDSGAMWSKVVDASAVFLSLVSISGLVLIFFLHKRRVSGFMALAIGALVCIIVYQIWVP
jgi:uncharacterized protein